MSPTDHSTVSAIIPSAGFSPMFVPPNHRARRPFGAGAPLRTVLAPRSARPRAVMMLAVRPKPLAQVSDPIVGARPAPRRRGTTWRPTIRRAMDVWRTLTPGPGRSSRRRARLRHDSFAEAETWLVGDLDDLGCVLQCPCAPATCSRRARSAAVGPTPLGIPHALAQRTAHWPSVESATTAINDL
jgi:hypothetical protein